MMDVLAGLKERYATCFRDYLQGRSESALGQAYALGREAVAEGASLLDIAMLHHQILGRFLSPGTLAPEDLVTLKLAGSFFEEFLSSFEMVLRGYREMVGALRVQSEDLKGLNERLAQENRVRRSAEERLRELNGVLEQRVEERTAAAEERARELARSNAELERFAQVVSHDLKEPLRTMSSYVQLLKRRYGGKLDPEGEEFIGFIVEGSSRMRNLLDDLMAYGRLDAEDLPFESVPAETALRMALEGLKLSIEETGAEVTHGPLPAVEARPAHLELLFQNLIGNALKFHGAQRPRVHVEAAEKDGEWVFRVRDNGIGIEPQYFAQIFGLFQRLHTGDEYPGTGIGLALCQKIVEQHGGRIWVESAPHRGSTFAFTLPKRRKDHE